MAVPAAAVVPTPFLYAKCCSGTKVDDAGAAVLAHGIGSLIRLQTLGLS